MFSNKVCRPVGIASGPRTRYGNYMVLQHPTNLEPVGANINPHNFPKWFCMIYYVYLAHNQKGANAKNRNFEMHIPKLLQNTRKTAPTKHQNASNKMIKNRSKMSPGAPPWTPRARDLFLKPFLKLFGGKMNSKMEPKTIQQVCFVCLLFRYRFSSISER